MCFSAESSFAVAGLLLPAGVYCVRKALREEPAYLGFALIPFGFSIQQAVEGLVWLSLRYDAPVLKAWGATIYLLFALAIWPIWFPLSAAWAEPPGIRRWILTAWTTVGSLWLYLAWFPVLNDPSKIRVEVIEHSLRYRYPDSFLASGPSQWFMTTIYMVCTVIPLLLMSRWREMIVPVAIGLFSAIISGWFYNYSYTSVWCFFAAVLSMYCVYFFGTFGSSHNHLRQHGGIFAERVGISRAPPR